MANAALQIATPAALPLNGRPVPPLEFGDRLTRDEFERRYEAMPEGIKAELIEGRVYMASPVSCSHAQPHASLLGWIVNYSAATPSTIALDNATLRLDLENEPQPDVMLRIAHSKHAASRVSQDDYVEGAPELVAEIAHSSASYDLHEKLRAYRRHGIREYLVWRIRDAAIDWFVLRGGEYAPLPADEQGILKSEIFPGLWLDRPAMLSGDLSKVFTVLQLGLASPEHRPFVEQLAADSQR